MADIKIGDKVRFDPFYGVRTGKKVTGKVIDIHEDHRWFSVIYKIANQAFRTSFNFSDLKDGVYARRVEVVHD